MDAPTDPKPLNEAVAWHALAVDEIIKRLDARPDQGLDSAEAARRLQQHGPNKLPLGKQQSALMRFIQQFNNVLVYVLIGAGILKFALGLWLDATIILGVVFLNSLLGFIQEGKAAEALESISRMLSAEARTLRDGAPRMIAADTLVPGDIVLLESGDKVPADLRLVEVKNLRTEEAALTGESVPADKSATAVAANATVGDRESMVFSGTMVVSGRATGVVVATGSHTELGRINELLAGVNALETPLLRQIKSFGYKISGVIAVIGALVFAFARWGRGMEFVDVFQAVIGIAVSVIPEGLPAIITITLAIGVQRMAQRNAIIRRLPAVETLGSVSRICSDKTGTLTLMEMMVVSAVTSDASYKVSGNGYAPEGEVTRDGQPAGADPVLQLIGRVSMLCNDAEIHQARRRVEGRGRPHRGRALPVRQQARHGARHRAGRLPAHRLDSVRVRASLHGHAQRGRWRQTNAPGQGRAGGDPRALQPPAVAQRRDRTDRPRVLRRGSRTHWPDRASGCWVLPGSRTRPD